VSWTSSADFHSSPGAFLFSLHRPGDGCRVKMKLTRASDSRAVRSDWWRGPTFGDELKMGTEFNEDQNCSSAGYFSMYRMPNNVEFDSRGAFLTSRRCFKAAEVEVFTVTG